ncbi:MAG TPA: hypothetical protein VNN74_11095 [Candidatus Micrarchaeia archaeon]|nr:hypothetical protein [Candidatus Micrarchaeia archaeon]
MSSSTPDGTRAEKVLQTATGIAWPVERVLGRWHARIWQVPPSVQRRGGLGRRAAAEGERPAALAVLASRWALLGTPVWLIGCLALAVGGAWIAAAVPLLAVGLGARLAGVARTLEARRSRQR